MCHIFSLACTALWLTCEENSRITNINNVMGKEDKKSHPCLTNKIISNGHNRQLIRLTESVSSDMHKRSATQNTVSLKIQFTVCANTLPPTTVLFTLTFSLTEGSPGSCARVRACFLGKTVQCCPWNPASSHGSYRRLSCSTQN